MRLPVLTLTAIAALFVATSASAQRYDPRYPVCMHIWSGSPHGGASDWYDCSFTSIEQCRATASGLSAMCDVNPYYAFDRQQPPARKRHKTVY